MPYREQRELSLKLATIHDRKATLRLIEELFNASVYSKISTFNLEDAQNAFKSTVEGKLTDGSIILLLDGETPVGCLVASAVEHMFNRKEKTGVELAFWITPEKRTRQGIKMLLKAYRYWCKSTGCTSILMGKLKNRDTAETYTIRKL